MVQQEKAKKSQAIVKKLSERSDLTAQQKDCLQRHQSTLARLHMGYDCIRFSATRAGESFEEAMLTLKSLGVLHPLFSN